MINQLRALLEQNTNFLITTHKSPDGDAIGSSVAWYEFLKAIGKKPFLLIPDEPTASLLPFLANVDYRIFDQEKEQAIAALNQYEVLFCLDYNGTGRVGKNMEVIFDIFEGPKVMIDHHPNPDHFCELMISRPEVCSTAQLVYACIDELGLMEHLNIACGIGIYLGILTDTGSFRFPSVDKQTHLTLAHLIEIGVEHYKIHEAIYDVNTMDRLRLRGYAIAEKLEIIPGLPIGFISLTKEELERFNYQKGDTEGLVNTILSIEGISIAAFFKEDKDNIKISFRSKGDYFVNEFLNRHFEGGGHKYAAGGVSYESLDVTLSRFKSLVEELIP